MKNDIDFQLKSSKFKRAFRLKLKREKKGKTEEENDRKFSITKEKVYANSTDLARLTVVSK